jgi:hypothetical protein
MGGESSCRGYDRTKSGDLVELSWERSPGLRVPFARSEKSRIQPK